MKQNICIIGLNNAFTIKVSKKIADAFDMFFADISALIEFELLDVEHARVVCGEEYIHKVERSKVKMVNSFENTLFTMDYSLLNDESSFNLTKESSYIVYLRFSKDELETINSKYDVKTSSKSLIYDVYEFRNQLCEKYADIIIDCDDSSDNEIVKAITNKFLKN